MADGIGSVAPAVVASEQDDSGSPPPPKRRQSDADEKEAKRQRLSADTKASLSDAAATTPEKHQAQDKSKERNETSERRRNTQQEERKRGQRLFGGLISTLSQSTPVGQQKRRQEIEKRQFEKAKLQKVEDEGRRAEKLAKLTTARKLRQASFDEESMRIRHKDMRAMANFLATKSMPKLYYKPWEMLPEQEDQIRVQLAEVEDEIASDIAKFKEQHPGRVLASDSQIHKGSDELTQDSSVTETHKKEDSPMGEQAAQSPSHANLTDATNDAASPAIQKSGTNDEKLALEEHNGEEVDENEEDTVIY